MTYSPRFASPLTAFSRAISKNNCSETGARLPALTKTNGVELSQAERRAWRERQAVIDAERKKAESEFREEARARAGQKWEAARPATGDHPYLRTKGVGAYGLRTNGFLLYVPVRDSSGTLHGLQYILPNGDKKFLTGTAKVGHYHVIGELKQRLLIAEGYATAATVHEITGDPVAVAFDAGNLKPVALALRRKYPHIDFTVCADDDWNKTPNSGLDKATETAKAVRAKLAIPSFVHAVPTTRILTILPNWKAQARCAAAYKRQKP